MPKLSLCAHWYWVKSWRQSFGWSSKEQTYCFDRTSLVTQTVKASAYNEGDPGLIFGSGRSPGEGNGNRFQTLAWKIPWTKEPGRLQSMGSQRVRHDWATSLSLSLLIGKGRHSRFMPPKLCPKLVGFVGSFIAKGQGCFKDQVACKLCIPLIWDLLASHGLIICGSWFSRLLNCDFLSGTSSIWWRF